LLESKVPKVSIVAAEVNSSLNEFNINPVVALTSVKMWYNESLDSKVTPIEVPLLVKAI
jgi:hypothetical protein